MPILVQIDDFTRCEYEPDGTGVAWSDNYTKVLTEKGRREQQDMAFRFTLPYGRTDGEAAGVDQAGWVGRPDRC